MYTLSMRRRRALDIQTVHQQEGRCESGELTAQTAHACSLSYACEVKVSRWRCLLRLLKSPTARLSSARMLHTPQSAPLVRFSVRPVRVAQACALAAF